MFYHLLPEFPDWAAAVERAMGSGSSASFEAIAYQVEVGRIHVFEAALNNSH